MTIEACGDFLCLVTNPETKQSQAFPLPVSGIGYRLSVTDSFAESDPRTVPEQRGPDPRVHEGEGRGGEAGRREPPCGRGLMRSKAEEGGVG